MSSSKDSSKDKFSRVVRFAQAEADQMLWQTIEKTLEEQPQSNFSDLCKQALSQYLLAQAVAPAPSTASAAVVATLQHQVATLQQQTQALQLQIAKLEGAIGMQQTLSLGNLEQQLLQLERRIAEQNHELGDRLSQLEAQVEGHPVPAPVASSAAVELDPLLSRLVPLLEDF